MSSTKKIVVIFACIFAVSIIGAGIILGILFGGGRNIDGNIVGAENYNINESSALELDGVTDIRVECASASIRFVESDDANVTLEGVMISPTRQKGRLVVSKEGGTLYVKVEQDIFSLCLFCDVRLTIYLPKDNGLDASINCSSGDVNISGMQFGDLAVSRSSGNLSIKDCRAASLDSDASSGDTNIASSTLGSIDTFCHSGTTTITDTAGSMMVRATSGDINIRGASGALDIGCTSGEVSIDMAPGAVPPVTATMTSGDLRFIVPKDAAFDLAANVTSGDVTSDLPVTISGTLPDSFVGDNISGTCNGGGEMVSLSATSGDIRIIGK